MSCKRDRTATCSTSAQSNKRRGRPIKYDVENVNCNRPVEDSLEQGPLLKSRSSYPGKRNKGRPGFVPNDNLFHSTGHLQLQRKLSSSLLRDVSNIVGNSSSSRSPFPPTEPFIPQKEHSMTIDSDDHVDDTYHDPGVANQSESITSENQIPPEYNNLGPPTAVCQYCHAVMWKEERNNKKVTRGTPKFSLCCCNGQVKLPPSKSTPAYLKYLYSDKVKGPTFKKCIRIYNAMLSFTSMGGNIDHSINKGRGPYVFKLNGVNHHRFGSLLPNEREQPKFCQLYIYDTENEVDNRIRTINLEDSNLVNPEILENLLKMLDETNELVKCFRMARDRFKDEHIVDLKIVMKVSRSTSGRENHMTPSNEVAAIMVGDNDDTCCRRDIVIESKIDGLKRISDLHPLLMALQYPLLFLYCEDGYHEEIYYVDCNKPANKKRQKVTQMEFYAHQLMVRPSEGLTLRLGGRLYQQFIVDAFSAVEQSRLWWIRCNQKTLRNELYHNLCDLMNRDDVDASNVGKGFILPASFVASQRYIFYIINSEVS